MSLHRSKGDDGLRGIKTEPLPYKAFCLPCNYAEGFNTYGGAITALRQHEKDHHNESLPLDVGEDASLPN